MIEHDVFLLTCNFGSTALIAGLCMSLRFFSDRDKTGIEYPTRGI
jgi:hypothetical protein